MIEFNLKQNYFELFGMKVNFSLDSSQLTSQFQALQTTYHPDKYASSNDLDKRLAVQISSLVNEAYQTLKDEVKRAIYIMHLNGIDLDTETDTQMDINFLMAQMELREEMEAVSEDEDGLDKIDSISSSVKKQLKTMMAKVKDDIASQNWQDAREILRQVQFMKKIEHETGLIQEKIEEKLY